MIMTISYKLKTNPITNEPSNNILKNVTIDGVTATYFVPKDEANTDYQAYLEWKAIDGNEPEAAD